MCLYMLLQYEITELFSRDIFYEYITYALVCSIPLMPKIKISYFIFCTVRFLS
jgi:hypothetical protein